MRRLPAEWEQQSAIQLTWPNRDSDWGSEYYGVIQCFVQIAIEICRRQSLLVVCASIDEVKSELPTAYHSAIRYIEIPSNDVWARDHGAISVVQEGIAILLDFQFNGWGGKFESRLDDAITARLFASQVFPNHQIEPHPSFVLEGGSIETDGDGTLLATRSSICNPNRNSTLSLLEVEAYLSATLGINRFLWLDNGCLLGDDTDGHIDTLARFCTPSTIAYVSCRDGSDPHFETLRKMEDELKAFTTASGDSYHLIPLPMVTPIYGPEGRLPATYANFLIMNKAVLLPVYNAPTDQSAIDILKEVFPDREIIPIDCNILIKQHGSLHCVTMQYPSL